MARKLIFCFDGTCNDPEDAIQEYKPVTQHGPADHSISNILKLHLLFGGDLRSERTPGDQMSFYYSGVGTYGGWFDRLRNMLVAPEHEDVGTIIKRATRDFYRFYGEGDELYVFGFSRGAAIARRFIAVLKKMYEPLGKPIPKVRFLGVFDTVAAINKPNLMREEIKPASDVVFEDKTISGLIERAVHLVSLDERRIAFQPTLMNRDEGRVLEVWFPGAHSDVGGGYHYDGLSDLALHFMLERVVEGGYGLKILEPHQVQYQGLTDDGEAPIGLDDVIVQPNHLGKSHQQQAITRIKERFLGYRDPRVSINDHASIHAPIIHHSVFDRMWDDEEYRSVSLHDRMVNPYTGDKVPLRIWYEPGRIDQYATLADAQGATAPRLGGLAIGENRSFTVYANQFYSPSRALLKAGERYRFRVDMTQTWFDATIDAHPDGWDRSNPKLSWFQRLYLRYEEDERRHPEANWFEVIGAVNREDDELIRILQHTEGHEEYTATRTGELFAFANDHWTRYDNNLGSIVVEVTRVG